MQIDSFASTKSTIRARAFCLHVVWKTGGLMFLSAEGKCNRLKVQSPSKNAQTRNRIVRRNIENSTEL